VWSQSPESLFRQCFWAVELLSIVCATFDSPARIGSTFDSVSMTDRAKRTIAATPEGLRWIEEKRRLSGKIAGAIGELAGVSRSSAQKFFKGQPITVPNFQALCEQLELDWQEVAGLKGAIASPAPTDAPLHPEELEALVERARSQAQPDIEKRCGWMKVLDMQQPIGVGAIYTDVNILEKITGRTRRELDELMQGCTPENFDRFLLGQVRERRVDGLGGGAEQETIDDSGTTRSRENHILKRLAILCNRGDFLPQQAPIFVTLKGIC
jgi:hypothetical protein